MASEVAQLLAEIEEQYDAARNALYGLAVGTARHDFIQAKMERTQDASARLIEMIGSQRAMPLIIEAMEGEPYKHIGDLGKERF